MSKKIHLLILFVSFFPLPTMANVKVDKVKCEPISGNTQKCFIYLIGKVENSDNLFIPEVADLDILRYNQQLIGSTGYWYGKEFYARFIPRIYSLSSLSNLTDPILKLEIKAIFGHFIDFTKQNEISTIVDEQAFGIYLRCLFKYFIILVTIFGLFIIGTISNQLRKVITKNTSKLYFLFIISALLVVVSMSNLPRIFMPTMIDPEFYYKLHTLVHSVTLFSLSFVIIQIYQPILMVNFIPSQIKKWFFSSSISAAFLFQLLLLFFSNHKPTKFIHQFGTGAQIFVLTSIVWTSLSSGFFLSSLKKRMLSDILLITILLFGSIFMTFEAVVYAFFHDPTTQYYFYLVFTAIIISDFFLVYQRVSIDKEASIVAMDVRKNLQMLSLGQDMLREISKVLLLHLKGARVSVVSIVDGFAMILTSVGNFALKENSEPQPLGNMLRRIVETKESIVVPVPKEFLMSLGNQEIKNICLMIPVIQEGKVIAAISLMANDGQKMSAFLLKFLEKIATMLSLEALSAINKIISENQISQLKLITSSSSGLVLEYVDSWGKIRDPEPARRVIISLDGVKSTYIDQMGSISPLIWEVYRNYKQEIYSNWMAMKDVFELVSSDVRGDDFWVLSPLSFKNSILAQLGAEKVALIAGFYMEKVSRIISLKAEYSLLQRSGFHASVSADIIEVLPMGIRTAVLRDIFAKNMSKIHRIRGEATPGSVLVDTSDNLIAEALNDNHFFVTRSAENLNQKEGVFPDVHKLPQLLSLIDVKENSEINKLLFQAKQLVQDSPYMESA